MTKSDAIQVYCNAVETLEREDGNLSTVEYNTLVLAIRAAKDILENAISW